MAKAPYTFDILAEAACCLWEAVCEWRYQNTKPRDASESFTAMTARFERGGTVDARHVCINLAETCCRAWDALSDWEQHALIPYDWEFCPTFLLCVDWENYAGGNITGADFEALVERLRLAAVNEAKRQNAAGG
jgi:hypothetical protein